MVSLYAMLKQCYYFSLLTEHDEWHVETDRRIQLPSTPQQSAVFCHSLVVAPHDAPMTTMRTLREAALAECGSCIACLLPKSEDMQQDLPLDNGTVPCDTAGQCFPTVSLTWHWDCAML